MNRFKFSVTALLLLACSALSAKNIYVSALNGSDKNSGDIESPYRTISKAAAKALAGDSVIISRGTYREWVSPANTGISPTMNITYIAAKGERVELKGSEVVEDWKRVSKGIYRATVDNTVFGEVNPYDVTIAGDWLFSGHNRHLGQVYIDGEPLREAPQTNDAKTLEKMQWYAEVDDTTTTIYANFGEAKPSKSLIEINARQSCFFARTAGINYITVDGLHISQAATQWAPPTGEQMGIIGPNWSKGWVIRNCEISHSKCVGISIGKERSTGHNMWSQYYNRNGYNKHGFTREIEAIISAIDKGWSQESIGSHLIENNKIYECGQAGIVGHMGCAFSTIRHNEIYNINYNNEYNGAETGGIKLHAAIDAIIEKNVITNSRRGLWLDWQAQGTHVRANIFDKNIEQDLFIEVSHGPTLIYNNIMLSPTSLLIDAQGILYANNLIGGRVRKVKSWFRYTPYHLPHSTKLRGLFNNNGGDIRFYNNIFLDQGQKCNDQLGTYGLSKFNDYPAKLDNSQAKGTNSVNDALNTIFPIYTAGNVYYGNSAPYKNEENHTVYNNEKPKLELRKDDEGNYHLDCDIDMQALQSVKTVEVNTRMLGHTLISEVEFENRDTTPFSLNSDFYGVPREEKNPTAGPCENSYAELVWIK